MASNSHDELQLSKKHEEILGKRAVLLQQMEICYEQQKAKKKHQATMFQAARERNAEILEDFQKLEERLRTRPLLHPDVLSLQTRYWASVEQKLPEWESYMLGKGQAPMSEEMFLQGLQKQKGTENDSSSARTKGRPPRPKPRSAD
ncbi:centrosomal protein 15 kDa [Neoarius graeffei]|uniref:centrosomal protein 15 kDa n=1 Tax=Neoarius graeffei TaxID=443677 RepID=UPI00298C7A19|nr:centrosomal protein 15 kDa [Neoarius graeffei]XP_060766716.1 centrosomal protein 15 kDa [Neoarius graeffei]